MTAPQTILAVDDDPDVQAFIKATLTAAGYDVATAASAEDGLRMVKADRPALILVDLMMEEVDAGLQFVRDVRGLDQSIPMFMLSTVGNAMGQAIDSQAIGLRGILQKPIQPRELEEMVAAAIA
jgi:CheY-like chemotaxis protein